MAAVRVARTTVTVTLRKLDVATTVIDDARVVVSELLGNALRHARPLPDGTLRVGLVIDRETLRLFVVDGGSVTLPTLLNPPLLSIGGRGLSIVRTLTRDWGVQETGAGNTVFGVLSLA
jgi:anti-sigma regulatory factor (Ser/Thr protein kinase)